MKNITVGKGEEAFNKNIILIGKKTY